jgi:hypothetical protein
MWYLTSTELSDGLLHKLGYWTRSDTKRRCTLHVSSRFSRKQEIMTCQLKARPGLRLYRKEPYINLPPFNYQQILGRLHPGNAVNHRVNTWRLPLCTYRASFSPTHGSWLSPPTTPGYGESPSRWFAFRSVRLRRGRWPAGHRHHGTLFSPATCPSTPRTNTLGIDPSSRSIRPNGHINGWTLDRTARPGAACPLS